jgi:hypothetical protein
MMIDPVYQFTLPLLVLAWGGDSINSRGGKTYPGRKY